MKRYFIIVLHIGYWILYLLLLGLFLLLIAGVIKSSGHNNIAEFAEVMISFTVVPALTGFYLFYVFLFDKYLSTKKTGALFFSGFVVISLAGLLGLISLYLITRGAIQPIHIFIQRFYMVLFMAALALIHGIIALVMKGFVTWYGDIKLKEELKQKNFETELALVRSQLSPHFLFNTINNIDVLIGKDPVKASAYLNKLSDIMRFMLYETKSEKIVLQTELDYIVKYIELQKIRSVNRDFVQYIISGHADTWEIAPMLFIPFIENAFKHSTNKISGHAVVIHIRIEDRAIRFYCENTFNESATSPVNTGIGNELIKKRLNLLYPSGHKLNMEKTKDAYRVELFIYKNSNAA